MSDTTALDRAILDHRANPTEVTRSALLTAQAAHVTTFHRAQAEDFIRRGRGR